MLETYRGLPVFFERLSGGNNGDLLMERGSRYLHQKYALRYAATPDASSLILLRGNGAMREDDRAVLTVLSRYAEKHPGVPLCMEPSTFHYRHLQLREVLPERDAPIYLFARDMTSFRYLASQRVPGHIEIGVDHDVALALRDSPLIQELSKIPADKVLVVERLDVEHPLLHRGAPAVALALYRTLVPKRVRTMTTPFVNRVRSNVPGQLRSYMARLATRHFPEFAHLPRLYQDVGDPRVLPFSRFLETVATCAAIVTTRLHAGILAAMLGKPTILVVGDYKKIQWIYEYSLGSWSNVMLHPLFSTNRTS